VEEVPQEKGETQLNLISANVMGLNLPIQHKIMKERCIGIIRESCYPGEESQLEES